MLDMKQIVHIYIYRSNQSRPEIEPPILIDLSLNPCHLYLTFELFMFAYTTHQQIPPPVIKINHDIVEIQLAHFCIC